MEAKREALLSLSCPPYTRCLGLLCWVKGVYMLSSFGDSVLHWSFDHEDKSWICGLPGLWNEP